MYTRIYITLLPYSTRIGIPDTIMMTMYSIVVRISAFSCIFQMAVENADKKIGQQPRQFIKNYLQHDN